MYESILRYGGGKYLWWALGLIALSTIVYFSQAATAPPSGSTWQGYVLGTVGALLIIWLSLLGVRKRQYGKQTSLESWVSGHVYLGMALLVVVLLHSAFQVGWNVHTLALVLLIAVIFSGIYGVYAYLTLPRLSADNRQGLAWPVMVKELVAIDETCLEQARNCGPANELAVESSIDKTTLGGNVLDQLFARDGSTYVNSELETGGSQRIANTNQTAVLSHLANAASHARNEAESEAIGKLIPLIARRQALLARMRRDVQIRALLKVWLYMHVPVTAALLGALLVHVIVVFLYW